MSEETFEQVEESEWEDSPDDTSWAWEDDRDEAEDDEGDDEEEE